MPVSDQLSALRAEVALGNRILAQEGVLDAFGHVSARHPTDPNRYLLSRSRAPELVEPDDVFEYTLDSALLTKSDLPLYSERVIHGEIYKARPDVMAVCHHHGPAFMPLLITGTSYVPVFHLGAVGGERPPFWDQRDEFGDTNLLVVKPEEGASLARRLGQHAMVLMNRHGVTAVGTGVKEVVFRSVYSCRNAEYQVAAAAAGTIRPLSSGETREAARIHSSTTGLMRAWEYWVRRLTRAGGAFPTVKNASASRAASVNRKKSKAVTGKSAPKRKAPKRKASSRR
jgi:HCOMODA/2-hydroxy-3-carboxy-muconic semialdehyde decarboxylase